MPRHYPDPTTVGKYLAGDYAQTYSDAVTIGSSAKPGYHLQARGRRETFEAIRQREPLRNGFGAFLSETEANSKIGDAARRHFAEVTGVEQMWKPCVHAVDAVDRHPKGHGKKFGHAEPSGSGVEYSDIPRGKVHVAPPPDLLGAEMDLFAIKRGRVYNQSGVNLSNAQSVPSEVSSYSEHPKRRHGPQGDRNGLPMRYPGDKSIAAVEFSPQFFASQKHRLGLEAPVAPMQRENRFAEKAATLAILKDRQDVANLPKYPKPAAPQAATATASAPAAQPLPPVGGGGKK